MFNQLQSLKCNERQEKIYELIYDIKNKLLTARDKDIEITINDLHFVFDSLNSTSYPCYEL